MNTKNFNQTKQQIFIQKNQPKIILEIKREYGTTRILKKVTKI